MNKNPNFTIKQEGKGLYSNCHEKDENYGSMSQEEMYMTNTGQIFSPSAAFSIGMYPHKDSMEDTVIRRTRSLIPHSVKCQIIQLAQDNPRITQGEIAQMFGIDRTTVSKILKRRHEFLEESKNTSDTCSPPKISKSDNVVNDTLCKFINLWYLEAKKKNERITQSMVKDMAQSIAKSYGVSHLSADSSWFEEFFTKHNIKESDIEDLVIKKEDPSSSDELILIEPPYQSVIDFRESPPRVANFGKRPGNRASHTATSHSHHGQNRQALSTSPTSTVTSSASRLGTGNKIPRVQTETADTTREDLLLDTRKEIEELETNEALKREMGNLDKFREQQKVMEEVNKQRKALLSKTLSERQKKAQEEARKLAHIQRELMILDNLLTADVNVIRSRIEIASREFLDAQKRYERAEKEFVESKVDLQKKSEQKESLTEHLYTIIHQNELRKSNKLSELMKELEMEQNNESQALPTLPPLSSFNTMSSGDTIHSPKSPSTTTTNQPLENVNPEPVGSTNLSKQNVNLSAAAENVNTSKDVKEVENVQSSQSDKKTVSINNENVNEEHTAHCLPTNDLLGKEPEKDKSAILTTNEKVPTSDTTINLTDSSTISDKHTNQNLISISPINIGDVSDSQNSEDLPGTWSLDVVQKDNGH
ncbi:uncharacterized protein LOC143063399 isoform X1 [Mytilus galloprovincialis]|uniref:uncharacterized protein LOC143063399 isoform X1 n=1 Tax=Mytilus galloprovincialis TaxID=29158 RepID=UPI003F7B8E5E